MTLARAWRRQLYGASSAALIVPSAMLAALVVLALGGGFGQVGVLGQIFAGPAAPSAPGATTSAAGAGAVARLVPAIPEVALRPAASRHARAGRGAVPVGSGSRRGGATLAPAGGALPIVATGGSTPARPGPTGPAPTAVTPTHPAPAAPSPQPRPSPRPTVADRVVKVVTPVAQQIPAPTGPAVTQAVQAAGSAADGVPAPGVGSSVPAQGLKLP
jgi:hypothetical protein